MTEGMTAGAEVVEMITGIADAIVVLTDVAGKLQQIVPSHAKLVDLSA